MLVGGSRDERRRHVRIEEYARGTEAITYMIGDVHLQGREVCAAAVQEIEVMVGHIGS